MKYVMLLLLGVSSNLYGQNVVTVDTVLMGSSFNFTAVHNELYKAELAVSDAIQRVVDIERMISSWDDQSETSEVNQNAGLKPVTVSPELFGLIQRAKKISQISNGYFDISFASINKVWDFSVPEIKIPTKEDIASSVSLIDFNNILLDAETSSIFLKNKGMKIGFGGIGKGFAANEAKKVMLSHGVQSGVVNAGGDLTAWGTKPGGESWGVGIVNPLNNEEIALWLDVIDMAVVTSGNYERYHMIEGERYCHIINPKTGWPCKGVSSSTIMCADAELADALATTTFILGVEDGMNLINHLNGIEGIMIDEKGKVFYSNGMKND